MTHNPLTNDHTASSQPTQILSFSHDAPTYSIITKSDILNHFEKISEDSVKNLDAKCIKKYTHFIKIVELTI